jgi:hypothetical protein
MPRPTKLTPDTQAQIVKAIRAGATYKDAAESAGVAYITFNGWMQRGDRGHKNDQLYVEFANAVTKAQADVKIGFTAVLTKAAQDGDWRAALEYLRRRDPDNWSDRRQIEHSGTDGGVIRITVNNDRD